jgi:DNA-binding NarL/FixJ family response regulator
MKPNPRISLLLAIEMDLLRKGLVALLEPVEGITVVGDVADGKAAVDRTAVLSPNVVVCELVMPVMNGISVCRHIRTHHPATEVLFLSALQNEDQMREAFEAGARAYLLKSCDIEELVFAIKKAARGDYYLSGPVSQEMVSEYVKPLLENQRPGGIMTQRERQLAKLLADGYSTKEAADIMSISPKTAETHRSSIMKKLNARNVTDIVKYCIRNHLIEA